MKQKNYYKIGGHIVTITASTQQFASLQMAPYEPFRIEGSEQPSLFDLEIKESLECAPSEPIIVDAPLSTSGMPRVDVYRTQEGLRYDVFAPRSPKINAQVVIDTTLHTAEVLLDGAPYERMMSLNNAVILCYISFGMKHSTLLLHASTVMLEGKAYLFLGKSGTGKSTHSRMWLSAFESAELLNDDHPILRVGDDGTITAYGSPWSGKTPCYRNLSAPLGAIVRISRDSHNHLEPLRPLKAFASITTSCSGAQWSKKLMDDKVKALEKIAKGAKCYIMHCLPNTEAAELCYHGINRDE